MMRLLMMAVLAASGCSQDATPPENNPNAVVLGEIDDVLPNPFKGFVPWIGTQNPVYDTRLQYKTFEWRDIEPVQGQYSWSTLESGWGNINQSGRRVGLRISAATPGSGNSYDIPDYLVQAGVPLRGYSIDGHQGLAPDWDHPAFLTAHRNLITALGNRYNNDPRIAWVDIGSYGFWGEWHVYRNDSLAATQDTRRQILEHYFNAFPDKHLVIAFDDDFATEYVTRHGGGIRNDCLGTPENNDWYLASLNRIDPTLNDRVWKTAIITGEFCGSGFGAIEGTTTRFDLNLAFIKQTHWSYIGTAGGAIPPQDETHRANLDLLHKTLGYRFVLREFSHAAAASPGAQLDISLKAENLGVAPFYYPWPLVLTMWDANNIEVFRTDLASDIRTWLPGQISAAERITLPGNLAPGAYSLKLAIHDPDHDSPGVMFANTLRDEN
ncbi:MAG TPA: DUF4832 domain-containing protein, partial [Calditrichia bacterium]|nr:DUF4832 domain-containing protein [Calditrichia bacterium]